MTEKNVGKHLSQHRGNVFVFNLVTLSIKEERTSFGMTGRPIFFYNRHSGGSVLIAEKLPSKIQN